VYNLNIYVPKITWNLYYAFEFNYVIVGHVNDRSWKIACYTVPARLFPCSVYSETAGQFDTISVILGDTHKCTKIAAILLGRDWSVDGGAGACKLRESDFLSLSGIPANQCREFSHGVLSSIYSQLRQLFQSLGIRYRYLRSRFELIPLACQLPLPNRVPRVRRHIRNSVSTIIPCTIRKTCRMRGSMWQVTGEQMHAASGIYEFRKRDTIPRGIPNVK